jgi:hypothetical protein
VPVDGAVGPKQEWTGTYPDDDEILYNKYNHGDAYTKATYQNGFEIELHYAFTTGYVQPDTNLSEHADPGGPNGDRQKVSFVANSGVKIGSVNDPNRYEIAIIDLEEWVGLTNGINQLTITGDLIDLSGQPNGKDYENEEVSRLMPGMLYKGEYKSGSGANEYGLTDADELTAPLTAADYRTLLTRAFECWDNTSMIMVADPSATDGIFKVYMKRKAGDHTGHNHTTVTHPVETEYYLFYRTNVDRNGHPIVINEHTRIHLQSHWGSGVQFSNFKITGL